MRSRAFSLIELLVTLSLIAVLMALLLPVVVRVRDAARASVCLSNQRQTTLALLNYATQHREYFVPNQQQLASPPAALWWFGYEPGGPGGSHVSNRPLDTTRGPLAPFFGGDIQSGLRCPDFPRQDPRFFPKFAVSSAHFGYNESLAPLHYKNKPPRRISQVSRPSGIFTFADAVHMDGLNKLNGKDMFYEPHYVQHNKIATWRSGFAHFRHQGRAQIAMVDGRVASIPRTQPAFDLIAQHPAANLDSTWGSASIYGFDTGF